VHALQRPWPFNHKTLDEIDAYAAENVERFLILYLLGDDKKVQAT
jgi:hypothetical protein